MGTLDEAELRHLQLVGSVAPIAASFSSVVVSALLIRHMRQLPACNFIKLLFRQLMHLAVAILVDKLTEILAIVADLAVFAGWRPPSWETETLDTICVVILSSNQVGIVASLLIESHIALAFAAAMFKNVSALRWLGRWLRMIWPLAILLACTCPFLTHTYWALDEGYACEIETDWLGIIAMLVTFVVCIVSYAISSSRSCKAGWHVQKLVWQRTQSYLLVAMLVTLPYSAYNVYLLTDPEERWDLILYAVAETLLDLNGVFYFIIYMLQNRSGRRLYRENTDDMELTLDRIEREISYQVTFASVASIRGFEDSINFDVSSMVVLADHLESVDEVSVSMEGIMVGQDAEEEDDEKKKEREEEEQLEKEEREAKAKRRQSRAGGGPNISSPEALVASMELKRQRSRNGGRSPRKRSGEDLEEYSPPPCPGGHEGNN